MQTIQQLSLFDPPAPAPPAPEQPEQPALFLYPLITMLGDGRSSSLYHIAAATKEQAIAIAEAQLRANGAAFRNVACLIGTYWRKSHPWGYPCCPLRECDRWK